MLNQNREIDSELMKDYDRLVLNLSHNQKRIRFQTEELRKRLTPKSKQTTIKDYCNNM